jgi:hypothetical protein
MAPGFEFLVLGPISLDTRIFAKWSWQFGDGNKLLHATRIVKFPFTMQSLQKLKSEGIKEFQPPFVCYRFVTLRFSGGFF